LKNLPAVIVWAVAFAFVEAAVVEYLRALYYPSTQGGFLFPLLTVQQLHAMGAEHERRLLIEIGRELATLVMPATLAAVAGRNRRESWAHFMIAFGVWDIFFYLWLKLFLDWPTDLMTWDLLFLIPVPWVAPVLAPLLISFTMIACGIVVLWHEHRDAHLNASWIDWTFLSAGGVTVIVSFCWDYKHIMAGGVPHPFQWAYFFVGLGISLTTFLAIRHRGSETGTATKTAT
jgi:hypothetical protein